MKEIKNNFKCCNKMSFSNDLLTELESKEELMGLKLSTCLLDDNCIGYGKTCGVKR